MRRLLRLGCTALALCAGGSALSAQARSVLSWQDLPALPDAIGFGGPFVGVDHDALIVAGGANFPGVPAADGGTKVWYDTIWVLPEPDGAWREAGRLASRRAYGAAVATSRGLVLIGGMSESAVTAATTVLRFAGGRIEQSELPPLPLPTAFPSAGVIDGVLYVAAGQRDVAGDIVDKAFWAMDLEREPPRWEELPRWPGSARRKAVACVQKGGDGQGRFYLIGGDYPVDGFRFDPRDRSWRRIADLPQPVAAATAVPMGESHILVFSGSTGRHVNKPLVERPLFPTTIRAYHTITDTWVTAGDMPLGVVTTGTVWWRDRIVVASGETRPGQRTNRVQSAVWAPSTVEFGAINYTVLITYLALLVGIGFWFGLRGKSTGDFFLAGRRIPWWAAGLSIYATQLSAITFVSTPALAYATNWLVAPALFMIVAIAPIVVHCFLPFFRRLEVTTAYEYLERRFSYGVRLFGSLAFIAFQIGRMAVVVYLPALALSTVTGIEIFTCILTMGILATLYTVLGGIEAVIWTDVVQVVVLVGGMLLGLVSILSGEGGLGAVLSTAAAAGKFEIVNTSMSVTELATWSILLGSFLLVFGPYTTDQSVVQRYLTTKDEKAAARGVWLNALLSVPFGLLFFFLGACLFVFFKNHPDQLAIGMDNDEVFPLFFATQMPAGLSGLVIAGVFAASMSSLDSSMHSIATAFTTDIYRRLRPEAADAHYLRVARWTTGLLGVLGTSMALVLATMDIVSLFMFFQKLLGLLGSSLVAVFLLAVFTRRATAFGALVGAFASAAALGYANWFTSIHFFLYPVLGIGTGVTVGYLASLVTPPPSGNVRQYTIYGMRNP